MATVALRAIMEVTDGAGLVEDVGRQKCVISMQGGEGATSRHAGINVEVH